MKHDEEVIIVRKKSNSNLKNIATLVYALLAISIIFPLIFPAPVIINYIKLNEVRGTWVESHFRWQIRTFWYTLLWFVVGVVLSLVLIGYGVLAILLIWFLYRIIKGWIVLSENREMFKSY